MTEYIDREDVREMMRMEFDDDYADEAVDRLPAADVAPVRHGRWLTWEEMFPGQTPKKKNNLGVFCGQCKNHADNRTGFCPHCGAKMDGGIEND